MEPGLKLAFSVSHNKGAYALLLGSGVSRSAEIPTGWQVTLDLIRKVALLQGEVVTEDDAQAWYKRKFGVDPNYSDLLKQVAPAPTERKAVLSGYFFGTPEEREHNIKVPQEAHRAIADLVAGGYIRAIITTNFDRLIEETLGQAGVETSVISTVDAIKGALPLAHATCTVVKVHGDYQDARILNTVDELSTYRPAMKALLKRIFDDYGLIVCGWSGDSDLALCDALMRRTSRRYTTYWTVRDTVKGDAQRLVDHLGAEVIQIPGADQFFRQLSENVKAIEDSAQPHHVSARVAEATVKRYVVDDRYRILLSDLVLREARRVHDATAWPTIHSAPERMSPQQLEQRLALYQAQTQTLMAMIVAGCNWGEAEHHRLWGRALRRLSQFQMQPGARWLPTHNLQLYPTLLAIYSGGIAALAADRYDTLAALLLQDSWPDPEYKASLPMAMHAIPGRSLPHDLVETIPGFSNRTTPASDYLCHESGIREATREVWLDDNNYVEQFDWFEFFLGMVNWDLTDRLWNDPKAYRGGFQYRENYSGSLDNMQAARRFNSEIITMSDDWPPLRAGFFGGGHKRAMEVGDAYLATLTGQRFLRE